jgi:homocitrate synthase NifV
MLIDSTLREGEQRFGVYFGSAHKHRIIRDLARAGVEEIECGVAGRDTQVAALVAMAQARGMRAAVWCACREGDLRAAAAMGPDVVSMAVPVSDLHIEKKLGKDRGWVLARTKEMVALGASLGVRVSLGLEDATRADADFALAVARVAEQAGAWRVRISDTVGQADPTSFTTLVGRFREALTIRIGVHCHNDFGLALANGLAALDAGAEHVDASLMGLGERAGIVPLEQLMSFLSLRRGECRYDLSVIAELARFALDASETHLSEHAPVAGERLFWCESGLHAEAIYKDPTLYEPYEPALVGAQRRISLGKKSGRNAVSRKLGELALEQQAQCDVLVEAIRAVSHKLGRALDDGEVARVAAAALPGDARGAYS